MGIGVGPVPFLILMKGGGGQRKVAMAVWGAEGEGGRGSDLSRAWADHSWDLAQ